MTTTTLTDLEIANLATRVAYMTDPEAIKAATDGQWVRVAVQKDPSGYQGVLIYNKTTNTYALLNAGTNGLEDIPSDVSLFFRNIAKTELDDAVNFARDIKTLIANSDHPDATFLIGGHSLGDWISKALVSLGFGSAPNGQAVSFGIDGPGLSPFKTEMADYAAEKGLPYDPSRAENGRYIISANSPISFGMDGYTNVRTDAVLTALEHVGWGYQAGIYIRTELQQAGYGDVQSRNLSQSEGVTLGIPASTFELNPRVTGFFDSTGKLVAYAQIGVNGNQVDLNAIQFYGMNGFDRYGTVTSGANEQLTCAISHKEGNVTTTQVDDGCNTSIEQIVTDSFDNAGNKTTSTKNLNANGTVKNEVVVTVSTNRETTVTKTDSNGDSVFDDVKVVEAVSDSASILTEDTDNNGSVDTRYLVNNGQTYDLENVNEAITADNIFRQFYGQGRLNSGEYLSLSQIVSQTLTSYYNPIYLPTYSIPLTLDPIGAFYEVKSIGTDNSVSIANKTGVLLNGTKQGMTSTGLTALDSNGDGKLSGTELSGLQVWFDANQNGMQEAGEVQSLAQAGISQVRSSDYGFYTSGNAVATSGPALNPVAAAVAALPTSVNLVQAVPASNYRSLRDTDNRYYVAGGGWIDFGANQIKINNGNRNYLIGTDGNDAFDANYYAAYSAYFTTPLTNFLAGGGDDLMGGSVRNDNLWGGTGNDTLLGYAGDDRLYGEEGNDELQGNEGNDYLDGGVGNDRLFGQVGNDTLVGGDGDDFMMGFTGTNEIKQTLSAGETDNDYLYGGNGNDTLVGGLGSDYLDGGADVDYIEAGQGDDIAFGGIGNDEMHGNEGNDKLSGDAGDDKVFGSVGNDTIWGGDGNDVLVGFTPTNDVKQTLATGETDNDVIYGGAGNDQIYGGLGSDYEDGGIGTDIVDGGDGVDTLFGGADDDEVNGGAGNDTLSGDAGADKVFGGVGNDQIWGGDGNDILVGFTATNEVKQTLLAGETDDDIIDGGAGDDLILGGFGNDQLFGGVGLDEVQGGEGNDLIYGNDGNDRLFGGAGNDAIYGGAGDDLIVGGAGDNEPALAAGVSDGNWLYGGEGNDTIVGGIGNDYIDGGLGADNMQGGTGNDTYIVNSVNDVILEQVAQGYDTVISSSNYILNANIEELRLVEGFNINGTGNSLNNRIIGNSADNILDGVTGADTMIGGLGNDTYYVDNAGDQIVEYAGEGVDTVQSKISVTLGENLENLNLLDFSKPEKGMVDGVNILVYGYPKANELDYMQGDAVAGYKGTCALTSIANLMTQANMPTSEAQVVNLAIQNSWVVSSPTATDYQRGGSNYVQQQSILNSYGIANTLLAGYNPEAIANLVQSGRGVIIGLNAGKLWNDPNYNDAGTVNHVVTITGAVRNASTGALMGFYIADSGRQQVSDMTRYLSLADFQTAAKVADAYAIYTTEALKLWNEDINGTGNSLDNTVIGNRGNNILFGAAGTDTLMGAQGSDTYLMQRGQGSDVLVDADTTMGNNDIISLAADISADQLWFSHIGNDLKINVIGTNDSYTVKDWYVGSSNQIEQIKTANGKTLSNTNVEQLVQAMSSLSAPAAGTTSLPTNYQTTLNPVIAANWQ